MDIWSNGKIACFYHIVHFLIFKTKFAKRKRHESSSGFQPGVPYSPSTGHQSLVHKTRNHGLSRERKVHIRNPEKCQSLDLDLDLDLDLTQSEPSSFMSDYYKSKVNFAFGLNTISCDQSCHPTGSRLLRYMELQKLAAFQVLL